jgi:hypothetical protein
MCYIASRKMPESLRKNASNFRSLWACAVTVNYTFHAFSDVFLRNVQAETMEKVLKNVKKTL